MKLKIKGTENKISTWRLNKDLIEKTIKNEIEQYVRVNETPEVAKATAKHIKQILGES